MGEQETRPCDQCANPDHKGVHSCSARAPETQVEQRLDALEASMQRIERWVMEGRPTRPGVFAQMGCAPAVTRSHAEVAAMYDGLRPIGVTMEYVPPTPAEAAIFERGGRVPSIIPDPSLPPGHGFVPNPAAAPPVYIDTETRAFWATGGGTSTEADAAERVRGGCMPDDESGRAAFRKATEERIADMTRRIFEADMRQTCEPRPTGPIVGLDAMLPPLAPAEDGGFGRVKATAQDLMAWRAHVADVTPGPATGCGAMLDEQRRASDTPAVLLGEAVKMVERVCDLLDRADPHGQSLAFVPVVVAATRLLNRIAELKREADARLVSCPRGIHGGPGSDACDCAAIAKAQAEAQGRKTCPTHGRRLALGEPCAACAEVPR